MDRRANQRPSASSGGCAAGPRPANCGDGHAANPDMLPTATASILVQSVTSAGRCRRDGDATGRRDRRRTDAADATGRTTVARASGASGNGDPADDVAGAIDDVA